MYRSNGCLLDSLSPCNSTAHNKVTSGSPQRAGLTSQHPQLLNPECAVGELQMPSELVS